MFKRIPTTLILAILCCVQMLFSQSKGGRWQMENNGDDTATWDSQADTGALQGNAAYTSLLPAAEGQSCLWLDTTRVYDYFKVEDSADLDFENENIGISMWIYPTLLNDVHFLVNKGTQTDAAKSTCYALRISLAKKIEFLIRDANNKAQTAASGFTVPLNQWTFVAAFFDHAAGKVYFWNRVTSLPTDSANFKFNFLANNGPLSIGSWYRNDPQAPSIKDFQGGIDDVRISGRREDIIPLSTGLNHRPPEGVHPVTLEVYPNPVSLSRQNLVTIQNPSLTMKQATVSLYNIRGELIHRQLIDHFPLQLRLHDIHGGHLAAGRYFIEAANDRGVYYQNLTIFH